MSPGTPAERWRTVPRAALARIALGGAGLLVVAALWAPWGPVNAWERFSRTDVLQCLLGIVMLAAAVAGRRSGAIVAAGVSLLVGAGAARQLSAAEVPAGVQLTLLAAAIGVVAAGVLVVETLEGDPVERWRRLGPDPLLRVVTALGALALLLPFTTWRASPPLPAILAVLAVAGLVSAALRSPRTAAAVGVAAGGAALAALVVAHYDTGFGPAVLFGLLAAVAIAVGALARLAEGWHGLGRGALAVGRSSALWAALVTLSVYPLSASVEPGAKLDESWIAALYLAAGRSLDYGTEIVFTYGPLGYLTVPRIISPGMFAASIAYVIAAYAAAAYAIVATARRTLGLVAAVVIAVFALSGFRIVATEDTVQVATASAALLAVAALLQADSLRRSRWWWWIVAAAGVLAAFHALIRLNVGLLVVLLAALRDHRRRGARTPVAERRAAGRDVRRGAGRAVDGARAGPRHARGLRPALLRGGQGLLGRDGLRGGSQLGLRGGRARGGFAARCRRLVRPQRSGCGAAPRWSPRSRCSSTAGSSRGSCATSPPITC